MHHLYLWCVARGGLLCCDRNSTTAPVLLTRFPYGCGNMHAADHRPSIEPVRRGSRLGHLDGGALAAVTTPATPSHGMRLALLS